MLSSGHFPLELKTTTCIFWKSSEISLEKTIEKCSNPLKYLFAVLQWLILFEYLFMSLKKVLVCGCIPKNILENNNVIMISNFYFTAGTFSAIGVGSSPAALIPDIQEILFIGSVLDNPLSMMSILTHSFLNLGGLPWPLLSARGSITVWMHPVAHVTCSCHLSQRDLCAEVVSSRSSLASRVAEGTSPLIFTQLIQRIMALSFRRRICMSSALAAPISPL